MPLLLSPGVATTEIDLTTTVQQVGSTGGGFAGAFKWGPAFEKGGTVLASVNDLINNFGGSTYNPVDIYTYTGFFTCWNFLQYGSNLTVVRAISSDALNSNGAGTGTLIKNRVDYEQNFSQGTDSVGLWFGKYPGDFGNNITVSMADAGNFGNWAYANYFTGAPNTSTYVSTLGGTNDELHVVVVDTDGHISGTIGQVLERYAYVSKASDAKAEDGTSNYYANVINNESAYIWWADFPTEGTNWGNTAANTSFTTLSSTLVFGTVNNSPFVTGEKINVFSGSVTSVTSVTNITNFTSVPTATVSAPQLAGGTTATVTVQHTGTTPNIVVTGVTVTVQGTGYTNTPTITFGTDATGTASATAVVTYGSFPVKSGIVDSYNSGTKTITYDASLGQITTADKVIGATSAANGTPTSVTGTDVTEVLTGGVDGNSTITDGNLITAYNTFLDTENVPVSLLLTGAADYTVQLYCIESIAEVTKTMVCLVSPQLTDVVDVPGEELTNVVNSRNTLVSSSYAFMDGNYKYQYDQYRNIYVWVPCNGDVGGLAVASDQLTAPWYSFAGLNRGILKNVIKLAWQPNQTQRDTLYTNGVNPILQLNGIGPVLYGDKTLLSKPSAFDRINVRRLFIVLELSIAAAAKYSLFEFNDSFTQAQFKTLVEPFLRDVQGQRGITDFLVVCDSTNNTPTIVDNNEFVGDIYIKPARSINFIYLNFIATPTGVSFSEIVGTTGAI
jgi:phage tail sheath protein FI